MQCNPLTNLCLRYNDLTNNNPHELRDTRYWMHPGKRQPTKDYVRNFTLFMQNEPKFYNPHISLSAYPERIYNNFGFSDLAQNEPKRTPNEPKVKIGKIEPNALFKKGLYQFLPLRTYKNEPKTNPKQTQFQKRLGNGYGEGKEKEYRITPHLPRKNITFNLTG